MTKWLLLLSQHCINQKPNCYNLHVPLPQEKCGELHQLIAKTASGCLLSVCDAEKGHKNYKATVRHIVNDGGRMHCSIFD